jgi:hypothetical protein
MSSGGSDITPKIVISSSPTTINHVRRRETGTKNLQKKKAMEYYSLRARFEQNLYLTAL